MVSRLKINQLFEWALDMYVEEEHLTENKRDFIKRIKDDMLYNENRRVSKRTIEHFEEIYPEIFEDIK